MRVKKRDLLSVASIFNCVGISMINDIRAYSPDSYLPAGAVYVRVCVFVFVFVCVFALCIRFVVRLAEKFMCIRILFLLPRHSSMPNRFALKARAIRTVASFPTSTILIS